MKEPDPHPACAQPLASTSCTQKPGHHPPSPSEEPAAPATGKAQPLGNVLHLLMLQPPGLCLGTKPPRRQGKGSSPFLKPHRHHHTCTNHGHCSFKANPVRCQQRRGGAAAGELLKPILHKEQERSLYPSKSFSPDKLAKPPVTAQPASFLRLLAFLLSIIYNKRTETSTDREKAKTALT